MNSFRSTLLFPALFAAVFAVAACSPNKEEAPSPASGPSEQAPATLARSPEQAPPPASGSEEEAQEAPPVVSGAEQPEAPPEVGAEAEAPAPTVVSGPLKRSDVLLSLIFYRPPWLDAFRAFHANRIVWTYGGERLIPAAAAHGIPVQCSVPFWVPRDAADKNEMACVTPEGAPVSLAPTLIFPDINSDKWRSFVLAEMGKLVDAGCTSFQQDGPWLNYQQTLFRNGCYSAESRAEFEEYLSGGATSGAPLTARAAEHPVAKSNAVDDDFEEFQRISTGRYHRWLHDSVRAYARQSGAPVADIIFSGNFAFSLLAKGRSAWLLPDFSFALSEAFGDRKTMPNVLRGIARETREATGVSGVTFPTNDVWLDQRSIATAYALGLTTIVPWDVHLPKGAPRFFGDPTDFAPLFRMVRTTPALFDDYTAGEDFYGEYGPVLPGQGTVTKVDRSAPGRTAVSWSRGASFQEVALGRQIVVGGVKYKTIVPSHVGLIYLPGDAGVSVGDPFYFRADPDSYLISVRRNMHEPERRAVHVVSWGQKPVSLFLHLRRSEFPAPPTRLVTPANPDPTPVEPQVAGNYYIYAVGNPVWAILY